ncbi:phosphotransferase [Sphingomonas sp. KC8]|uniref:phosphotransferase n=1 Tax=Sphingomonas sp. KC8 TaxID=1030157 RepID=UPI001E56976C|nr:phosphotransferase [Sphingomonas sp. KC8]
MSETEAMAATRVAIPMTLDGVSAEWLTAILQSRYPGIVVEAMDEVHLRNSHTTKYQVRLTLNEIGRLAGIPEHVCLKANWAGFDSKDICRLEARFYENFRRLVDFPAPRYYFADWADNASGQGFVMMEDLAVGGGKFGHSTDHMGVEEAARGVASLARLHGAFWDSPVLHAADWLPVSMATPTDSDQLRMMYQYAELNHPKPEYQAFLPQWIRGDLSRLHIVYDALVDFARHREQGPYCLVHGDSHQGNSYVRPDGERVWLDWQMVRKGRPIRDFTYFILGALTIEERRAHDRDLLRHYRECLVATGAQNVPDDDMFWESYRRWPPYAMQAWIANMDEWGQIGMHIVERIFTAGEDLKTVEALGVNF